MAAEDISQLIDDKEILEPKTGVGVEGDAFWSRPREMLELVSRLESGASASLFGLRRIGKSSIMKEAARHLRTKGHTCIFLNTEGMSGPGRLLVDLVRGLEPSLRDKVSTAWANNGSLTGALKKVAGVLKNEPVDTANIEKEFRDFWEPLTQTVERQLKDSDTKVFVFIDELPFFLSDQIEKGVTKQSIIDILATLRRWRQDSNIMAQVLCGSIGMAGFLRLHDIDRDHNNDAPGIYVGPLNEEEANKFLDAVAKGHPIEGWSENIRNAVIEEAVEFYPSYLQEVLLLLKTEALLAKHQNGEVTDELLITKLHDSVMPKIRKGFEVELLNQFDKRLARLESFDKSWSDVALSVLRNIQKDGVITRASLEEQLADAEIAGKAAVDFSEILSEDAFVAENEDGNYTFGDRIIEIWLNRRHGEPK